MEKDDASSKEGKGRVVLSKLGDEQTLSTLSYQYPLKLISPRQSSQPCTSVFIMSYGGGLVGGDKIDLSITVKQNCKLALLTQGSTKIFKRRKMVNSTFPSTQQSLTAVIERDALLALLPDPIQPFADSCYEQFQSFELHPQGNLLLLDWLTSGRPARGETWTLNSFKSRNDILFENKLILRDTLILNADVAESMGAQQCFATVVMKGPLFREFSAQVVGKFKGEEKIRRSVVGKGIIQEKAIWTAGTVREECCVVKVAGQTSELVKEFLRELLVVQEIESLIGREALRALI
jgi:urease accessory protein